MQLACQVLKHHYNFSHSKFAHKVLGLFSDLEQLHETFSMDVFTIHSEHDVLVVYERVKSQSGVREFFTEKFLTLIRPQPQLRELAVFVCHSPSDNGVSPCHHLALCLHAYAGLLPLCGQLFTAHHFMHIPLGFGG